MKARLDRKGVMMDRDGLNYVWDWGEDNLDCILQPAEASIVPGGRNGEVR